MLYHIYCNKHIVCIQVAFSSLLDIWLVTSFLFREIKKGLLHHNGDLLESPYSAIALRFLDCDTIVSFRVDDFFHKLNRGQVNATH